MRHATKEEIRIENRARAWNRRDGVRADRSIDELILYSHRIAAYKAGYESALRDMKKGGRLISV